MILWKHIGWKGLLGAALLVAMGGLLTACAPFPGTATPGATGPDGNGGQETADLAGTAWILTSLRGQPPIADTHLALEFTENGAAGFAGCNSFGSARDAQVESEYVASGGELVLPPLAQTLILCSEPEGVMDQENAYMEALRQATAYRLEGDVLELQDEAGETILTFQRQEELSMDPGALPGTAWRLVSLDGQSPVEGSTLTLAFHDEHRAGGHAGCRDYVLGYRAGEDGLNFYYTAMMGHVCIAPDTQENQDRLLRQEGTFTDALSWTDRFRLAEDGSSLELLSQRGESLVFEPLAAGEVPPVEGTTWALVSFVEPNDQAGLEQSLPAPLDTVAGTDVTLEFRDGTAAGTAGCNQYTAPYSLEGAALGIEDPVSTKMFCEPEGVMEQEQRLLSWLAEAETAQVHGRQMWLVTGDGRALVFTAGPGG